MKKYLKFNKCKAGHWIVMCGKQALACVYPKGQIFKKRMVFQEDIDMAEWTSECLYQLADFIASEENGTRKTAHNTASMPLRDLLNEWPQQSDMTNAESNAIYKFVKYVEQQHT